MFATSAHMTLDDAVNAMATPRVGALGACWWWTDRGHMLTLSDDWDVRQVTQRVNGLLTDLSQRIEACGRALAALAESPPAAIAPTQPHAPQISPADALMQAELDALNPPQS